MHHFELEEVVTALQKRVDVLEAVVFPNEPVKLAVAPSPIGSMGQEFDLRTERPATDDDPF